MGTFMETVKKYGPYVIAAAGLVYNFGLFVMGWWDASNPIWVQVDAVIAFVGLGSIRAALSDLFAGIDLGPVGTWLTGNKTYIMAIVGSLFNILVAFQVILPTDPIAAFINALLAALGVGSFALAMKTYKAQALKAGGNMAGVLYKRD